MAGTGDGYRDNTHVLEESEATIGTGTVSLRGWKIGEERRVQLPRSGKRTLIVLFELLSEESSLLAWSGCCNSLLDKEQQTSCQLCTVAIT